MDAAPQPAPPGALLATLPPEVLLRLTAYLPPNEVATSMRWSCHTMAALLGEPRHKVVQLSQPVPPHAFVWKWGRPGAARSFPLSQRRRLLELTAASGCVANLAVLMGGSGGDAAGCTPRPEVCEAAARAGSVPMLEHLWRLGCPFHCGRVIRRAAAAGRIRVLEWAESHFAPFDHSLTGAVLVPAAAGGQMALLRWAVEKWPNKLRYEVTRARP